MHYTATYSPDDNKLRLYASSRLDSETYNRVKAEGFKWAPQQGLFVAPMWTPEREDLLIELAGEVGDEDTSLLERAEDRSERFEEYSDKRAEDAERARESVAAIADNVPLGQPILVGHHSEKHARKDAEKIENGMRRTVKMWETSQYWKSRAAGAIRHAKYKERSDVRARRIKTIEAAARKIERNKERNALCLKIWTEKPLTHEQALHIAGHTEAGHMPMPRKEGDRPDFNQCPSAYTALKGDFPNLYAPRTVEEVLEQARLYYPRNIENCERWLTHYSNRLEYERAMLAERGGTVAEQTGPEVGGACKCWASPRNGWSYIQKVNQVSVSVLDNWGNGGPNFKRTVPFDKLAHIMSKAQVEAARAEGRLLEVNDGLGFILTGEPTKKTEYKAPEPTVFDGVRNSLKAGVQVVSAPQLFPTPVELAKRMVRLADIKPGNRVLEPSAGTGNLIRAMGGKMFDHNPERGGIMAVEINAKLAGRLRLEFPLTKIHQTDFLTCNGNLGAFDRIVMNPPFQNAEDIKHIQHARTFLNPGGRLVALCANGPRQQDQLKLISSYWEDLPAGTFEKAGTGVNVALLVIEG